MNDLIQRARRIARRLHPDFTDEEIDDLADEWVAEECENARAHDDTPSLDAAWWEDK